MTDAATPTPAPYWIGVCAVHGTTLSSTVPVTEARRCTRVARMHAHPCNRPLAIEPGPAITPASRVTVVTPAPAADLTGWDARLTALADGLDLGHPAGRLELAKRLLVLPDADVATLRALASWLGQSTRARKREALTAHVALGWQAEQAARARTAARAAAGTSAFSRLPSTDDEGAF